MLSVVNVSRSLVLALVVSAGGASAQVPEAKPVVPAPATKVPAPKAATPQLAAPAIERRAPRLLPDVVKLKVAAVVDGRVLAGQKYPPDALAKLGRLGFTPVQSAAQLSDRSIFEGRLYRAYAVRSDAKPALRGADFEPLVGREVQVRVSEVETGRLYAIVALLP